MPYSIPFNSVRRMSCYRLPAEAGVRDIFGTRRAGSNVPKTVEASEQQRKQCSARSHVPVVSGLMAIMIMRNGRSLRPVGGLDRLHGHTRPRTLAHTFHLD